MKKDERDWDNVVLSLRLKNAEARRFWKLMDIGKKRNPYIDRTNIIRELLELDQPKILTETEIRFFRQSQENVNKKRTQISDADSGLSLYQRDGLLKNDSQKQTIPIVGDGVGGATDKKK